MGAPTAGPSSCACIAGGHTRQQQGLRLASENMARPLIWAATRCSAYQGTEAAVSASRIIPAASQEVVRKEQL